MHEPVYLNQQIVSQVQECSISTFVRNEASRVSDSPYCVVVSTDTCKCEVSERGLFYVTFKLQLVP
jgi:hypothetical protein